ncbi:hypothetical protein [Haliovirga abyssi]|uniref:Uncharacterized protein n=1 Tax=Haliovirga abyssi TaxID=2996794 RepID=A0AAU9DWG2_9FUSO|nr:hypothetical protein [Haliovirga abyssi]BDU50611.1 hypothetical protein HLVA_11800 [Haliovirga abyssi]
MTEKQARGIVLAIIVLVMVYLVPKLIGVQGGGKAEKVRKQIEESLLKKYGEEFIVDRIGIRKAYKDKFYQARIYPKSKLKNGIRDKYYEGSASVDIGTFGILDNEAGDSYWIQKMNDSAEEYLIQKVKKIFGNRVRLKVDVKYKKKADVPNNNFYVGKKKYDFKKAIQDEKNDKKDLIHLEVTLYIYIFDKINNEEEKEKRREEIFKYINYLKEEGLFKYLEMGVIFIDERVLAPSYRKYKREIFIMPDEKVKVEGETVYLPPMKLRKEMSEVLGEEVKKMSEKELIKRMNMISKGELDPFDTGNFKYSLNYISLILSIERLKLRGEYEEEKENNKLEDYKYLKKQNIKLIKYKNYIY